jgi:flagellar biosynthesis protein FlhB
MNIDQLTKLILTLFILTVTLSVLVYSLISYYKTYMTNSDQKKLKNKIKFNLFLIVPLGSFILLFLILLLYAFIMNKNILLILKNIISVIKL